MYMYAFVRVTLLLIMLACVKAQHRRNKIINTAPFPMDEKVPYTWNENIPCAISACMKRSFGQDDLGPFWANRGKRNPNYFPDHLYVEEPYWIWVRRDESGRELEEPFFTSRGKKDVDGADPYKEFNLKFRDRRDYPEMVESPFFAARGKKLKFRITKF